MAFKTKQIYNSKTKLAIRFLQTGADNEGQLLEMEATYNQHSKEPPAHYHPRQEEDFTVLAGELTVRIDGKLLVLKNGESLHIPKNKVHSMWNNSSDKTIVNWKIRPALHTDNFLETITGLANDGLTDENGKPDLLQLALMANKFDQLFRLAKPAFIIQKMLFVLLAPFAYLRGYTSSYKKYTDRSP